ncbi:hypothetical protein D9758_014849 [Tetrapyrgos nigripes]|uniref:Ribonuclease H1 N-terminal domain-containing protein n=1 Tax=Tetrapyrgos nigripes TaxID=182062 RepID=A0A8H5FS63_9AGAR|nr:hypothetical protein D9758_014849 [Tetrapyrgos nigripes]
MTKSPTVQPSPEQYQHGSDNDSNNDSGNDSDNLWDQLENLSPAMSIMALPPRPTCQPRVYDSQSSSKNFKPKLIYNVYTGDAPGIYTTWDDVSGWVIGVSKARYKSYNSYRDVLHGWRQNCVSTHHHPDDFIDGSIYVPDAEPIMRATTPPPHTEPLTHSSQSQYSPSLCAHSSQPRSPPTTPSKRRSTQAFFPPPPLAETLSHPSQSHHSTSLSAHSAQPQSTPTTPSKRRTAQAFFGPESPAWHRFSNFPQRGKSWAVTTGSRTAIVNAEMADEILREAHLRGMEAQAVQVNSVQEAEELLAHLDLDTEKTESEEEV